ncbi:MAG TPA: ABC transporter permease [Candidatus Sulfopaludibacter sp.]|jgi:putative ABC transport system permease protein|nr:ABC transporter permease [Candidatus Sulfopaludibacter sp.]
MLADFRYAVRTLIQSPRFSLAAVAALALGIGANSAMFSVVYGVLLRPLPFPHPERLMFVQEASVRHEGTSPTSPATFKDWSEQQHSFSSLAAAEAWGASLTGSGRPEELSGLRVSPSLLGVLQVSPELGRGFTEDDQQVVLLSHSLWQRRFGGDAGAVGSSLTLNGAAYRVVGVMPAGFHFPPFWAEKAEVWTPLIFSPQRMADRGGNSLRVFGRLRDGVSVEQARAEMTTIASRLKRAFPESYGVDSGARVLPLDEVTVAKVKPALLVLLGAVMFLLLIACANVANLLLARASGRRKEIALRLALGAARWRLVRQLLAESLTLAAAGGALGLVLAWAAVHALASSIPDASRFTLPRYQELGIGAVVVLFTFGVCAATGILFGLAPVWQFRSLDLHGTLKEGSRGSSGRSRTPLRSALVVAEVAVSLMLLAGAGLMVRSMARLSAVDSGFDAHNVLSMRVVLTGPAYREPEKRTRFYRQVLDRVAAVPGIESASGINHLPLAGDLWTFSFTVEGRPAPAVADLPGAAFRVVMPGYFQTMHIPLLRGRDVTEHDDAGAPPVVLINRTMAERFWPGEDAVGKRIRLGGAQSKSAWTTVAGVVKDAEQADWGAAAGNEFYFPYRQNPEDIQKYVTVVARTSADPAALIPAIEKEIWSLDRDLPVEDAATMQQVVERAVWQPRSSTKLLAGFAGLALLLAAIGIYGVISYGVSQRRHEIGIRMALGARPANVLRGVLSEGAILAAMGTVIGVGGALALTRYLQTLLYQVSATDPLVLVASAAILGTIALVASYLPARRATKLDPMTALRQD